MTTVAARLQGFISSLKSFSCACVGKAPATGPNGGQTGGTPLPGGAPSTAPFGGQTGGTPAPAALPEDVKRYLDEARSQPRELCSYIFRELNMPWLRSIENDLVKLIKKSYNQAQDSPPEAPDKTAEILEVSMDVLEVFNVSLPFGIGVAFGLTKLALEYKGTADDVKELRRSVLRAAVGLLVQVEQGSDKLPHNSPIPYFNYHATLYEAFNLCCTATWPSKANRDALLEIENKLHELSTSYGVSFQQATTTLRANAEPVLTTDLVGVDSQFTDLMTLLSPHGDTKVVLLHGMGGSGKTELAKAAYVEAGRQLFLAGNYGYCMLDMLKGEAEELDKRLHAMLRHLDIRPDETDNLDSLHDVMMKRLSKREKPVLLFIDNVRNAIVSESLLSPAVNRLLPKGSRVLITSRDKRAASNLGLPPGGVLPMNIDLLDKKSSEVLLSMCLELEGGDAVSNLSEGLVSKLVEICGGLPLALTVLGRTSGSYIQEKGPQEALRRIEELANYERTDRVEKRLHEVLMRSFDLCDNNLRMAFLDIITFYEPYKFNWELVGRALHEGTCKEALERLQQLSLVEKRNHYGVSVVGLHDQMKVVGQLLMKEEPGNRTHVAIHDHNTLDVKGGFGDCRSVIVTTDGLGKDWLGEFLAGLSNKLRLLSITDTSGVLEAMPLAHVAWCGLRCLHVDSQALERLELPNSNSGLTSLQVLRLSGCEALQSLPGGISKLVSLQELRVSGCKLLQSMPDGISGLTGLQRLRLSGCQSLQSLPHSISGLTGLQELDISWCKSLRSLPDGISGLTGLRRLDLKRCEALHSLLNGISGLVSLQELRLSGCKLLQSLPDGMRWLTSLRSLRVSGCKVLQSLPDSISELTSLQVLDLSWCQSLQSLPDGIKGLTSLQVLDLSWCRSLHSLPDGIIGLTSLQVLRLSWCVSLQSLPNGISGLTSLQVLDLSHCEVLQSLPDGINGLASLQELELSLCQPPQSLPASICALTSLRVLRLGGLEALQSLPSGISGLTSLQVLRLSWCESPQSVPGAISGLTSMQELQLNGLNSLQELEVTGCQALQSLPDSFSGLTSLQVLDFSVCKSLQSLPDGIIGLTSLQVLRLSVCDSLHTLPDGISGLSSLLEVDLSMCKSLQSLPNGISGLTSLQRLDLKRCEALQSLPDGISGMAGLRRLDLGRCQALQSLPDGISGLASLQVLDLSFCEALRSLPNGISRLSSLLQLDLSLCQALQSLPDGISGLTSLQVLDLSLCKSLQSLPGGINGLAGLQWLDLSGCESLQSLPDNISGLISLQELRRSGCEVP